MTGEQANKANKEIKIKSISNVLLPTKGLMFPEIYYYSCLSNSFPTHTQFPHYIKPVLR